jgi:hypothetical protein
MAQKALYLLAFALAIVAFFVTGYLTCLHSEHTCVPLYAYLVALPVLVAGMGLAWKFGRRLP